MAPPVTVISDPLTPISGDRVVLVEGTMANPVEASVRTVQSGDVFYLTFAAEKGKSPQEVARILKEKYNLKIRHWAPESEKGYFAESLSAKKPSDNEEPGRRREFDLYVDVDHAYHYLDPEVRERLRYFPDTSHLAFKFGKNADYFMIGIRFNPEDHDGIFPDEIRIGVDDNESPTGESINTLNFDIIQYQNADYLLQNSALELATASTASRLPEVIHIGGLSIYDRRDIDETPAPLHIAHLTDNHYSLFHDTLQLRLMGYKLEDGKIVPDENPIITGRHRAEREYLIFNNANDVLEAEVEFLRRLYREGRLDMTISAGDIRSHNSYTYKSATRLEESNTLPLSDEIAEVPGSFFSVRGNHESLKTPAPAFIPQPEYQTEGYLLKRAEFERHEDLVHLTTDIFQSLEDDPRGTFHDLDILNRFENFRISREGDGDIAPFESVAVFTGVNDVAHLWPNDRFYLDLMQGVWFTVPWFHPVTIARFILHKSPDVEGTEPEVSAWASRQKAKIWWGHGPFYSSKDSRGFDPTDKERLKIVRAYPAGPDQENNIGAQNHYRREFQSGFHQSSETVGYVSGHDHTYGNEYVSALNRKGKIEIFKLPFLAAMKRIVDDHENNGDKTADGESFDFEASLAALWRPAKRALADPKIHPAVTALYEKLVQTHHDIKVHYQLGSSGVGKRPVFGVMTYTDKGNLYYKAYYPVKDIVPHPDDPPGTLRYVVVYKIPDKLSGGDEPVVEKWDRLKEENPKRWIDMTPSLRRIVRRRGLDASRVASADSLKPLPRVEQVVDDAVIDPTSLYNWLRVYYVGNQIPTSDMPVAGFTRKTYGVHIELAASMIHTFDPKFRSYLCQGASVGWNVDEDETHKIHAAWNFPNYVHGEFLSKHVIVRGLNPRLGVAYSFRRGDDNTSADDVIHRSLKLIELNLKLHPVELNFGLLYDWTGTNQALGMAGASIAF